ncbi:MAG: hypothetical protein RIC30_09195 [Marinoscillum sp.]|uniref:hypothetical protein n=1 Tax=Marinoscillum sp. TaxID=2024838 RepID=UPI0032FA42EA
MSSHHIVRDQQEPALILHRLDSFPVSHLHALLEWSPTVICCEPAIDKYTSLGHKLDFALVSLNHFESWKSRLDDQQPVKIIAIDDSHFLMTGLTVLQKEDHRAVNIITDEESIFDVLQLATQWLSQLDLVVFTEKQKFLFVKHETFRKWLPARTRLSLMALNEHSQWHAVGFEEDVKASHYQELDVIKEKEGEAEIRCSHPPFVVIEDLDY